LRLRLVRGGDELQAHHDNAGRPIGPGFVAQICAPWPGLREHGCDDRIPAGLYDEDHAYEHRGEQQGERAVKERDKDGANYACERDELLHEHLKRSSSDTALGAAPLPCLDSTWHDAKQRVWPRALHACKPPVPPGIANGQRRIRQGCSSSTYTYSKGET